MLYWNVTKIEWGLFFLFPQRQPVSGEGLPTTRPKCMRYFIGTPYRARALQSQYNAIQRLTYLGSGWAAPSWFCQENQKSKKENSQKRKSVTKFKFFFFFLSKKVIIPPLPLHIFKTHSLLLWIFSSIFNFAFFLRSLSCFPSFGTYTKSCLIAWKPGFKPSSHIPHIHYGTSHLFIPSVENWA